MPIGGDLSYPATAMRIRSGPARALASLLIFAAVSAPTLARAAESAPTSPPAPTPAIPPTTPTAPTPAAPVPPPYVPDLGPAPAGFRFGPDSGRQLLIDVAAADAALGAIGSEVVALESELPPLERARRRVALRVRLARTQERGIDRSLDRNRSRVQSASARAYVEAQEPAIVPAVDSLLSAGSAMDASRALELIDAYNRAQFDRRDALHEAGRAAERTRRARERDLAEIDAELLATRRDLADARARYALAEIARAELEARRATWLDAAPRTAASPIMGPTALRAADLVRMVRATGYRVNLTVSLEELAAMFIEEGEAEGVRGDVAFAQSILETGSFGLPATGNIVVFGDNNFAGIGACDSCDRGTRFRTAREGVRAQIQALRLYADPTIEGADDFANPMVLPGLLDVINAGKTKTWYQLTGKWATGAEYGLHVYAVYQQMYRQRTVVSAEPIDVAAATSAAGSVPMTVPTAIAPTAGAPTGARFAALVTVSPLARW